WIIVAEMVFYGPGSIITQTVNQLGIAQRLLVELDIRQPGFADCADLVCEPGSMGIFQGSSSLKSTDQYILEPISVKSYQQKRRCKKAAPESPVTGNMCVA